MDTFAIVLFVVGGILVIIAFILIVCLVWRYRRRRETKDDANDEFKVVYKPKKRHKHDPRVQTIDVVDGTGTLVAKTNTLVSSRNGALVANNGTVVVSNGTLVHSKPKTIVGPQGTATLIPATMVVPHGSTLSVDKTAKKRRLPSDASSQRVIYQSSHIGTRTRPSSRTSSKQRGYSASYAYGTAGHAYHNSSPEINALVLSGDIRSGKLKVLDEMPRERRVQKWLHRQHAGGVVRAASNDAIDADRRSLSSDVFDRSSGGENQSNALKLRWSPWMDRKMRKTSESESYVDARTLPAHYEKRYIYPQYTGKAMSSL